MLTDSKPLPRTLVVIVAWNSAPHLAEAVGSVPPDTRVIVVDNASTDGSADIARAAGARVVRLERNSGFGPACNLGAHEGGPSETLLLLNPDAALEEGEPSLAELLAELDRHPEAGAVAPALVGDGQESFQLRRLPTLGSLAREALLVNRLWPRNPGFLRERYLDRPRDHSFEVEQPAAAALLVRRELFDRLGGFDPRYTPAWFEDVDLCDRIWQSGFRIRYVPAARVRHVGGTTMKSLPYRDFLPLYTRNLLLYLDRHRGLATRAAARVLLAFGAALRLALLSVARGDHARGDAAAAYLRVLRGLLGFGFRSALLPAGGA